MPLYDYKCQTHGVFQELATLSDYDQPCPCPQCGQLAARVIVLAPDILNMAPNRRHAFATNEKACHEPIVSTAASRDADPKASGCNCNSNPNRPSRLMYTADGKKFFPSMRPWMISH